LLAAAESEGVSALLHWRLHSGAGWQALPARLRDGLQRAARDEAVRELFRSRQLLRVSQALADAGIEALLLKGQALALWLYPQPQLRECADIDLLFASRADAGRAAQVCEPLGYALAYVPGDEYYEMTSRLVVDGTSRSELDLHDRLLNSPLFGRMLAFDELWREARALPGLPASMRGLSLRHALLHACMNRALDLQNRSPDRLKLLVDIDLMAARMDAAAWGDCVALARDKGLAGTCLRNFEDARALFASPIPGAALDELRRLADAEDIDWRRLDDWRYMQWQNLKALPDLRTRLRWLRQRLVPGGDQLHALHGDGAWWHLVLRRAGNGLAKMRGRSR
jgi:hypothetical protein